jgi:glutamate synthase (NADPH/NADH) large chain
VATQDPELRKRFSGKADYLVNYFTFLAQEVRELLAELGCRSFDEIVGRPDMISLAETPGNWKAATLDVSDILHIPREASMFDRKCTTGQPAQIENKLDQQILRQIDNALLQKERIDLTFDIKNTDRTAGAMISGVISRMHGRDGLPEDTVNLRFKGSAGQSFGAFLVKGVRLTLEGDANDYLGKGLSGGKIIVVPPEGSAFQPEMNIIAGNTLMYGATSGEVYINGIAGERFCVRNSGALAVVEGTGDHCCEYMTGGRTVVLGKTGRNFAAGMSGGIAYVLNEEGNFDYYCNMGMVELSLVEELPDIRELEDLIRKP